MKRTIKNLFSAPTDSRTGGARLGARMLPAPMHLRRLFVALVALLTMTAQTAWADTWPTTWTESLNKEYNFTGGGSGTDTDPYWVNMKADYNKRSLYIPNGVSSFMVYDDGGKDNNYSTGYSNTIALVAPTGYLLRVSGHIKIASASCLSVIDGDKYLFYSRNDYAQYISNGVLDKNIPTLNSSGNKMELEFNTSNTSSETTYEGLALKVELVNITTSYNMTIESVTGGSVSANKENPITFNESVTLTATPSSSSYTLCDINVKDGYNQLVALSTDAMPWYSENNTYSFSMPLSNATATPKFTNNWTADGGLYINMPKTGTKTVTIKEGVQSFKVYDDGGKDGKHGKDCEGTLVLTAPSDNYVFEISGSINAKWFWRFYVYDGDNTKCTKLIETYGEGVEGDITTKQSSGSSITIYFKGYNSEEGLNLTVKLIDVSTMEFDVNITQQATGGTLSASKSKAKKNDVITLSPSSLTSGYMLNNVTVTRNDNSQVVTTTGGWYTNNQVTFTMPLSAVTAIPTYTNAKTAAAGLSINMLTNGTKEATIPADVQSFKVYDDGGANGYNSLKCDGTLILTAPSGYGFQLSGSTSFYSSAALTVYDSDGADDNKKEYDTGSSGHNGDIPIIYARSGYMTLHYETSTNYEGLNLTVTPIELATARSITVNKTGNGTVTVNPASAKPFDEVTLTATPATDNLLCSLTVKDADKQDVALSEDLLWYTGKSSATFTMPLTAVTVAPTFTNTLTADGGLYVNMPTTGSKKVTVPDGVTSFKVYDDGGKGGECSYNCDGTLVLTAPEGKGLLLLEGGYDLSTNSSTNFVVYDGEAATEGQELLGPVRGWGSFNNVASTARSMTIYLKNTSFHGRLDLTVTVLDFTTQYNITINNPATGPSITANPTSAHITQDVTLTSNIVENSKLVELTVKDGDNQDVTLSNDLLWYSGKTTATFDMPGSTVTVTPTFMNASSAKEGLYIKMPISSKITADLPTGVESFKVINDAGDHNSSDLVLTAPEGYVLQLEGTIIGDAYHDHLEIYDGLQNNDPQTEILDIRPIATNAWRDIPTVTSTGRYMYIDYYSSRPTSDIELKVTIVSATTPHNITVNPSNPVAGGTLTSDKETAVYQEVVTLSPSLTDGYVIKDLSIVDEGTNPVAFEGGWYTGNTVTFKMATTAVTVSPVLTNDLTRNGGLYINLPRTGTKTATIPANVKSFKVYDDGGSTGNYSDLCSGKLVLEAPEGYRLQLAGQSQYVTSTHSGSDDFLIVYDNKEASGTQLVSKVYYSGSIGANKLSSDRYMTIYFKSDGDYYNAAGIDLGITVKKPLSSTDITVAPIDDQTWTGSEFKPTVTIKDGETDITNQCDITFSNNTNVGTATVTITAKDESNYYGSISTTFNIVRVLFAANTSNLWMTWCDKDEYVKPVGVTVYSVSGVGTDKVTLAEVSGDVIPAYTPVLLYRAAAGEGAMTATFSAVGTAPASGYDAANGICSQSNQAGTFTFFGATTAMAKIPDNDFTYYNGGLTYVLYGDKFLKSDSNNGIAANRCWLKLDAEGGTGPVNARQLVIVVDDETTAVESEKVTVNSEKFAAATVWYTLDGRKLSGKPTKKGLYIYNGKKVAIK